MERNITYLQRFRKGLEGIANKHELNKDEIDEIIDHFFQTMKKFVTDPRMPTIKVTNLGTFKPSIGKLNWQIRAAIKQIRAGKPPEKLKKKISRLWSVKQRLIKEKRGDCTWKKWRDKDDLE